MIGHSSYIVFVHLDSQKNLLYSLSADSTLKAWNLETQKLESSKNLIKHEDAYELESDGLKVEALSQQYIEIEEEKGADLFISDENYYMQTYVSKLQSQKKQQKWGSSDQQQQLPPEKPKENKAQATCAIMLQSSKILFIAYSNLEIVGWDIDYEYKYCYQFQEHVNAIVELLTYKSYLVSVSLDHTVRFWNLEQQQQQCVYKLSGPVNKAQITDTFIYALTDNRFLSILKFGKEQLEYYIELGEELLTTFTVCEPQNLFITCSSECNIRIYDINQLLTFTSKDPVVSTLFTNAALAN